MYIHKVIKLQALVRGRLTRKYIKVVHGFQACQESSLTTITGKKTIGELSTPETLNKEIEQDGTKEHIVNSKRSFTIVLTAIDAKIEKYREEMTEVSEVVAEKVIFKSEHKINEQALSEKEAVDMSIEDQEEPEAEAKQKETLDKEEAEATPLDTAAEDAADEVENDRVRNETEVAVEEEAETDLITDVSLVTDFRKN